LAALFLHHFCGGDVEISIYEQASQYKEIGAGVGIGVNAVRLLHKIGLGDATAAIAGHREDVWISFRRFDDGQEIITVASDTEQKIRQCPVHRAEFLDLLVNAVQDRRAATLWTNKQCSGVIVSPLEKDVSAPSRDAN
jgi:salicylate hydroxylase